MISLFLFVHRTLVLFRCPLLPSQLRVISDGPSLQWLEAGFWFLARDWGGVAAVRELNPSHSTCHHQWQGPDPSALQKRIPTKMESGETSKVLIRRKTVGVNRHTRVSSERSSHPHRSVNHSYGVLLPGLLWPVILLCLGRWIWINPYLVYLKVLPCMGTYLGQDGF